jgi:hypothetical protein
MNNKKAVLFTITTIFILLTVLTLTSIYVERNKELQYNIIDSSYSNKVRFIEDDVISDVFSNLLSVNLKNITRSTVINVSFDQILLSPGKDYYQKAQSYEQFIEGTYSNLNNINIELTGFGNNFTIRPFNTINVIKGENITVYTNPSPTNYVERIGIIVDIDAENNSVCSVPTDDSGSHPEILITYIYDGGSCTNIVQLDPEENNDQAGKQFYLDTINPIGYIEIKFGIIPGYSGNGVLNLETNNITVNVTGLYFEYELSDQNIDIISGNLTINSATNDLQKHTTIVLAEE